MKDMENASEKLYRALQQLLHNSVDSIGLPKRATIKQLQKALDVLNAYEKLHKKA